jgi:cysteinyl-tRNA synthetase
MKMSKSKGNFYVLEDVLERGFSAMDLRMLYLSAHYRSQMNFTWEALEQAKKNKDYLFKTADRLKEFLKNHGPALDTFIDNESAQWFRDFNLALEDDLNTPLALAAFLELARTVNISLGQDGTGTVAQNEIDSFNKMRTLFGLTMEVYTVPENVLKLAEKRKAARINKDFTASDALRDEIAVLGYIVEDGPTGQTIRKK